MKGEANKALRKYFRFREDPLSVEGKRETRNLEGEILSDRGDPERGRDVFERENVCAERYKCKLREKSACVAAISFSSRYVSESKN